MTIVVITIVVAVVAPVIVPMAIVAFGTTVAAVTSATAIAAE